VAIELVTYRDAHFDFEEGEGADAEFVNRTVGWVTEEALWLRVVHEQQGSGDDRAVTRIPHGDVVMRHVLLYKMDQVAE
jgi:hypothetical protein